MRMKTFPLSAAERRPCHDAQRAGAKAFDIKAAPPGTHYTDPGITDDEIKIGVFGPLNRVRSRRPASIICASISPGTITDQQNGRHLGPQDRARLSRTINAPPMASPPR